MASPFDLSQIFNMIIPIMGIILVVVLITTIFKAIRGGLS